MNKQHSNMQITNFLHFSVGYADLSVNERKQRMKQLYGFDCNCEACMNDYPLENVLKQKEFQCLNTTEREKYGKAFGMYLLYKDRKQLKQSFLHLEEMSKKSFPTFKINGLTKILAAQLQFDQREYQ